MNLKKIMIERNLTFPELFEKSNVSVRTIEDIIKRGDCRVSTAIKLADALNITLDELCREDN